MARWLIELQGESYDLEEFPRWFPDGDIHAFSKQDRTFLSGSHFDTCTEPEQVHQLAEAALEALFAVICLLQGGVRKPVIACMYYEADDGKFHPYKLPTSYRFRAKLRDLLAGEDSAAASRQGQQFLAACQKDPHLTVAVSLLAIAGATWPHLYRALEEVESYLGKKVDEVGLCTKKERKRFTHTANSAEAAGINARHGLSRCDPPADAMPLVDARGFITNLIKAVLEKQIRPTLET
jgi:hypothetical protein